MCRRIWTWQAELSVAHCGLLTGAGSGLDLRRFWVADMRRQDGVRGTGLGLESVAVVVVIAADERLACGFGCSAACHIAQTNSLHDKICHENCDSRPRAVVALSWG